MFRAILLAGLVGIAAGGSLQLCADGNLTPTKYSTGLYTCDGKGQKVGQLKDFCSYKDDSTASCSRIFTFNDCTVVDMLNSDGEHLFLVSSAVKGAKCSFGGADVDGLDVDVLKTADGQSRQKFTIDINKELKLAKL